MELNEALIEKLSDAVTQRVMEKVDSFLERACPRTPDSVRSSSSSSSSRDRTPSSPTTPVRRPQENTRKRTRSGRLDIPRQCQSAVRTIMNELMKPSQPNPIQLSYDSYDDNIEPMARVIAETKRVHKGRSWLNEGNLKEACKKVWRNKRDDHGRKVTGKKEAHRERVQLTNWAQAKLLRRKKEIKNMTEWDEDTKDKWCQGLFRGVMSPEKHKEDDRTIRYRIPFEWSSREFRKGVRKLDASYVKNLNPQGRARISTLVEAEERCSRPPPPGTPEWMIDPTWINHDLADDSDRVF